jgi:hypothetical protein
MSPALHVCDNPPYGTAIRIAVALLRGEIAAIHIPQSWWVNHVNARQCGQSMLRIQL